MCPSIPGGSVQCVVKGLPDPTLVWSVLTEAHEVSESDQGQPTGGQAGSVEATGNGTSLIEVSGRAGCELNTV